MGVVCVRGLHSCLNLFYRPPSTNRAVDALIEDSFSLAFDSGVQDIIVVGDFNYNPSNRHLSKILQSLCNQFSLTQCIEEPTHFTENSASIIDIILVKNKNLLVNSGVGDPFLDQNIRYHCPIFGIFNFSKVQSKSFKRLIWNYDTGNYDQLRNLAALTDWENLYNDDVNLHARNITDHITSIAKDCIYSKTITVKPNEPKWINSDIKRHIRKRKRAYKKAKRTGAPLHWEQFRNLRNETITMIRKSKSAHTRNLAHSLKSGNLSTNNWWKTLKNFITPTIQSSLPCLQSEYGLVTDDSGKANLLNDFFCKQTHIDESNARVPILITPAYNLQRIVVLPNEVEDVLHSLPMGKAVGPDGVNNRVLRELSCQLAGPLCSLFNNSLRSAKVPDCWKEANVCPIFKAGDKSLVSNYRPISLLNTINKVKIIFKHLYNYIRDNNVISTF